MVGADTLAPDDRLIGADPDAIARHEAWPSRLLYPAAAAAIFFWIAAGILGAWFTGWL